MLKKSLLSLLVMVMFLVISGCAESGDSVGSITKGRIYQLGVVTPLSGPQAGYGLEQKALLDLRVAELNAQKDYAIELVYKDGKCESDEAVHALRELVEEDKVKFVIGGFCAGVTLAMAPVVEEYGVILLTPSTTNAALDGMSEKVMSLAYPDTILAEALAEELAQGDKFATLSENAQNSGTIERDLDNLLTSQGKVADFVFDERFDSDLSDFTDLLKELEQSRAEVVLLNPESGTTALALLGAIESSGLKIKLIGTGVFADEKVLAEASDIVNGMTIIGWPEVDESQLTPYMEKLLAEQAMSIELLDPYFAASSLDALDILSKLVAETNGDVASVQKGLSTGSFSGFLGKSTFAGATFRKDVQASKKTVSEKQVSKFGQ